MPSRPLLGGRSFTLPHSLRSRGSVKDVVITTVKNVMEQNRFTAAPPEISSYGELFCRSRICHAPVCIVFQYGPMFGFIGAVGRTAR